MNNARARQYYLSIKQYCKALLLDVTLKNGNSEQLEKMELDMLSLLKPQSFSGSKSSEVKYMKQFEDMCLLISSKNLSGDPEKMTMLKFMNAWEHVKAMIKPKK